MTDLFGNPDGHNPLNAQHSLFGDSENLIPHPKTPDIIPDPNRVREKLLALLETAKAADRMPWTERKARMWQIVFPQMANWLPDEEANQLRFEFAQEIERLKLAA